MSAQEILPLGTGQDPQADFDTARIGEAVIETIISSKDVEEVDSQTGKEPYDFSHCLELYGYLLANSQYEAGGIWNRFNIIISIDVFLFGIIAVMLAGQAIFSSLIIVVVSTTGSLFSLWSMFVLHRLWQYHSHWKYTIKKMEEDYFQGRGWPTAFAKLPPHLLKEKRKWYQTWILSYTQPFFLILFVLWTFLAVYFLLVFLNIVDYPGPIPAPIPTPTSTPPGGI